MSVITDEAGHIDERMSYDAFGMRRDPSTWQDYASLPELTDITDKGYTGQQQLDTVGLVHMNGRVYDPVVGRFMSADPTIPDPLDGQSFNRYAYVENNPLSAIDPSGYFSMSAFLSNGDPLAGFFPQQYGEALSVIGPIVGAALNVVPGCQGWCDYVVTMASEAEAGYLETGSVGYGLRAGALAGAEAFAFSYVGGQFGVNPTGGALVERSMIEGIVGGAFSSAGGGRFSDGFLGAFVGSESSGLIGQIGGSPSEAAYFSANNESMRVVLSMLIGGTAARLTGGNFTEGALAAAFQRIFNDDRHARLNRQRLENVDKIVAAKAQNAIDMLQAEYGMDVIIEKDAYRSFAEEDRLYVLGLSKVQGGFSWHNYGLAVDVVEIKNGEPDWHYSDIDALRSAFGSEGFKYYINFDPGHFYMPMGNTLKNLYLQHLEAEQISFPPWY